MKSWKISGILVMVGFVGVLLSCDQNGLTLVKKYEIPYPHFKKGTFNPFYFLDQGRELLSGIDPKGQQLDFADFHTGELVKSINLEKVTESFHVYTYFFHPLNLDSIFLLADHRPDIEPRTLLLINGEGEITNQWRIDRLIRNRPSYASGSPARNNPMLYFGGKMFFHIVSTEHKYSRVVSRNEAYQYPTELMIDLQHPEKSENSIGKCPKSYFINDYYDYFPSRCINKDGNVVYSYGAHEDVIVYDNMKQRSSYNASSKYISYFSPLKEGEAMDMSIIQKYMFEEPRYKYIIYDGYRDRYYRVVHHRSKLEKEDGTIGGYQDIKKSIVVLDQAYNWLGEILLNEQTYGLIIGAVKDGILISEYENGKTRLVVYEIE